MLELEGRSLRLKKALTHTNLSMIFRLLFAAHCSLGRLSQRLSVRASRKKALSKIPVVSIIDDDGSVRTATTDLVRSLGHTVHAFASAEEFLQSNELNGTSCIIADVQMPKMSGIELQAHLLAQGHSMPFIFITAFPTERVRATALKAGATCFLTKPFNGDALVKCLDAALERRGQE